MSNSRIEQQRKDVAEKSATFLDNSSKSDLANDFNAMKHKSKKMKSEKVLFFLEKVQPLLENRGLLVNEFNTNSFRITNGVKTVDYFPSSSKLFIKDKNEWKAVKKLVFLTIMANLK